MMQTFAFTLAALLVASTAYAQMNWFTPSAFSVTCLMQQRCVVNEACTRISQTLTITHNPDQGLTRFTLPDGTLTQGVLGVMSSGSTQTLTATTSEEVEILYRINIFPDASVSMAVLNYIDRPEDTLLYGTCKSPES